MDGIDFVNRLDDDSMHLVFDNFQTPKDFLPFGGGENRTFVPVYNLFNQKCFFALSLQTMEWFVVPFLPSIDVVDRLPSWLLGIQKKRSDR